MLLVLVLLQLSAAGSLAFPGSVSGRRTACKVLFDGRVLPSFHPSDFDTDASPYNTGFVHGQNQTWADIITFPNVPPSLFDAGTKPFEVTINDGSIFAPGGNLQAGFRRSELIPDINNGSDVTVRGTTTVHWSVRSDSCKPLNLSHEYQIVFHETSDFSTNQFMLKTGAPFGETFDLSKHKTLRLEGRQTTRKLLFSTPFDDNVWHNFALTLTWDSNAVTVYYSKDRAPLKAVNRTTNDNSGKGQQHFGILKLPTGPSGIDVAHGGFQESRIFEGLAYAGIFIEDSSKGCVTLS